MIDTRQIRTLAQTTAANLRNAIGMSPLVATMVDVVAIAAGVSVKLFTGIPLLGELLVLAGVVGSAMRLMRWYA